MRVLYGLEIGGAVPFPPVPWAHASHSYLR